MPDAPVAIVSGLPRSGTSLMMQMIAAGGLPALTDGLRVADADNPRGYLEYERVKRTKADPSWLAEARGRVVKMVHLLLRDLPVEGQAYRVVMMRRRMPEVLASQRAMLARQGRPPAAVPDAQLAAAFQSQMEQVLAWLRARPAFAVEEVHYHELVADPVAHAARLNAFLGGRLDEKAMACAVEPSLYRQKGAA